MESAEGVEEQEPMEGLEKSEERAEEFVPIFAHLFYHAAAAARCFRLSPPPHRRRRTYSPHDASPHATISPLRACVWCGWVLHQPNSQPPITAALRARSSAQVVPWRSLDKAMPPFRLLPATLTAPLDCSRSLR